MHAPFTIPFTFDAWQMREFFKPHMQMFARLVGQSFGTWAVDDKDKQVH